MALHYNLKECNLEGVPDNIVTEMIYEDLMSNKDVRAMSPKDLN